MLKNTVEIYDDQEAVAARIEELKNNGYHDTDMYVVAKGEHRIDNLKGRLGTLADEKVAADKTLWEKFRNLMGAEEEFQTAFDRLGMDDHHTILYSDALDSGKILLIIASDDV